MNKFRNLQVWLSPPAIALYFPVSFISTLLALPNSQLSFWEITWIAALITAAAATVLALGLLLKPKAETGWIPRMTLFTVFTLLAGGLRGWLLAELTLVSSATELEQVTNRVINSALSTTFWLFCFSLIYSVLEQNQRNFQSQFAQIAHSSSQRLALSESEIAEEIDGLQNIKSLKQSLRGIAQFTNQTAVSEDQLLVAAAKLRAEIENSLRPLSHRIWFNELRNQPQFRLTGLISQALVAPKFDPLLTALLSSAWFVLGAYTLAPIDHVLTKVAASGVSLFLLLLLARRFSNRLFRSRLASGALILGICYISYFTGDFAVLMFTGEVWIENAYTSLVLLPFALAILILVLAVVSVLAEDFELINGLMEESGLRLDSQTRSRFAGYLHNSLQAELTSLAMQLERAAQEDRTAVEGTLARLAEVAERSIGSDFTAREVSPADRLRQVVSNWRGIILVQVNVCPELASDLRKLALFVELCEEAIANAARHAKASEIQISTMATEAGIQVWIQNPISESQKARHSLGTAWLNRYAKVLEFAGYESGFYQIRLVV